MKLSMGARGRVAEKLVLNGYMVNARHLEPVFIAPKRVEATLKEMEVVGEGGFQTSTYFVHVRGAWPTVYSLVGAKSVEGIEVELLDGETAPGVSWRRWLRVVAPVGTAFRKRVRTPDRYGARIDREGIPYKIQDFDLRLSRHGHLMPPRAIAEEARRAASRVEPKATASDVRRSVAEILAKLR